ncbi:hypothetical protein NQ315_007647 [Exocentrus adspersus]|uniref:Uncharacterized protein n=1 Tax=Exocentrus adspersus TaxID=1586481 RepID=A0AAV8W7I6_9CUCU|nr:hypothetical protein NQ315_007647 [Exocentrus adspersus]
MVWKSSTSSLHLLNRFIYLLPIRSGRGADRCEPAFTPFRTRRKLPSETVDRETATDEAPKLFSVFNVLGETLARLQQDEEAERWYMAALHAQPDHVPAHITYGKLLAKNSSRGAEAEQWFRKAQRLAPEDPSVYHHYGEFLASRGREQEAANMYEKAAELRPGDYELAMAAATAMREAGRFQDAERWYRKTVSIKPMDARSHTNLGAILHLNGKYKEAAESYRRALKLQPNDITTLKNLHKLHSAQRDDLTLIELKPLN